MRASEVEMRRWRNEDFKKWRVEEMEKWEVDEWNTIVEQVHLEEGKRSTENEVK
jgi:hypothetical protein